MSDKPVPPCVSLPNYFHLQFLLFVALQLTGAIDWSWWWVTAWLWIPYGLIVAWMAFAGVLWVLEPYLTGGRR